jgi:hypothetical protein
LVWSPRSVEEIGQAIPATLASSKAGASAQAFCAQNLYLRALRAVVEDRTVDDAELARLRVLEAVLPLERTFLENARTATFREVYFAAVADHDLTQNDQLRLEHIRERLDIEPSSVADELRALQELAAIRRIGEGDLPVVTPSIKLQSNEVCHAETPARLLKRRVLGSYQRHGVRYKQVGYRVDKEGILVVTSERIALVHQGMTSIRHDKVIAVEVDLDRSLIIVTKNTPRTLSF